ncbi:MAG: 4-hydroxy-tetrahydrodipicolinate reductase [Bacteroidales bacterium]|nr:4-hydroxy-tetrahydrodipicolinate reductase [Bacteroidales bacterium]
MKIALLGYGKMGHEVEKNALAQGHEIVVTIDNEQEWNERIDLLKKADVAIEFSQPDQAFANINRCFDLHLPIVVGTTAWYDRLDEVKQRCNSEGQSLFYAPNFSIGMNMVFMLNKQLARFAEQYGYSLKVAETHHIHKLDKPSGTAAKLANDILAESGRYQRWSIEEPFPSDTLPIEVTREGEVFGIHSITALSSADRITLTHEAFSREGLAKGALAAAQFLIGKTGVFTMVDLFC